MDQDRSDIESAIGRDRAQIAETLEALERKADVRARVSDKVGEVRSRVKEHAPSGVQDSAQATARMIRERPSTFVALGLIVIGVVVGRVRTRGHP
jgi:ElaB/YqjD/DUF883 family membrane-anchored ribosome-binding protein